MKKKWNDITESVIEEWKFLKNRKVEKFSLLILLIFSLSSLDAFFTLVWIKTGLAVEANPLLSKLIAHGDFAFLGTKILLTGVGCLFLESVKDKSVFAKISIVFLLIVYGLLTVYHIFGALQSVDHSYVPDFMSDILVRLS